ncbi:uncharacterized protein LOC110894063 isoform X1 [Helianthus annuus]|uniref:uncharacterized protein LOC110894063 isoform X1 n=1 Tax=Helianthus annuus TaxID=4232 RepID=UPI000B8F8888|nr:uncharacterized protein LOC110894063 isoform X1 [Helianthus annuus]XP_021996923.1 uncharacterized protein LOC110894063 isoform X1 [Helianthus annuus]XP_035836670.1 uncharacterized protein LOC110894063 isoform X1 [Helianthus annuus]
MCGREPNFELTAEEKDELSKLIWDDFLTMTRNHDFSNFWKLMEKDFVGAATDLRPSCGVNRMIRLIELDRNQGFQIKWWNLAKTRLLVVSAFNAYVTGELQAPTLALITISRTSRSCVSFIRNYNKIIDNQHRDFFIFTSEKQCGYSNELNILPYNGSARQEPVNKIDS